MFDFTFKDLDFSPQIDSFSGIHLWIIHADKIPPHIGFSIDNHYFSLKANGKDNGISTDSILQIIQKKKIGTVIVKLNFELTFQEVNEAFEKFESAKDLNSSCLVPIKNILNAPDSISKLSEMLHFLETQNTIYSTFGLHLSNEYKGIKSYTTSEIQQRIEKLKRC
ncbi:MAG: hypothetical protein FGM14_12210 [Flavobacteriales bacterium]|nr:hypothetical protein [Flavobacteriales bacterium]